jgi:hypothetical protein
MTDDMFKQSMKEDALVKQEMIINIGIGGHEGRAPTLFSAFSEDPSKSYFNVNAESYLKTANGQKDANFKARYEGLGVTGVLTPTQQHYKNQMEQSFMQLYGMELDLLPHSNTKVEILQGYYDELVKNKTKMQTKNPYTEKLVANIKPRLQARILQLQKNPKRLGETFTRQCWKDGKLDEKCKAEFAKAHGTIGSSSNKATNEILFNTLGINPNPEPPKTYENSAEE